MKREWLQELARDFVALGSPVFFILVLVRLAILPDYLFLSQFFFAGTILISSMFVFKQNIYSGLGLILLVFLILYYKDFRFSVFIILAYLGLAGSLFYLKKDWKKILLGILFGGLSVGISYYLVPKILDLF